jgi:hypothetical protein
MTEPVDRRLQELGTRASRDAVASVPDVADIGRRVGRRRRRRTAAVSLSTIAVLVLAGVLVLRPHHGDGSAVRTGGAPEHGQPPDTSPTTPPVDPAPEPCPPERSSPMMYTTTTGLGRLAATGLLTLATAACTPAPESPATTPPTSVDAPTATPPTAPTVTATTAPPPTTPAPPTTTPGPTRCTAAGLNLSVKELGVNLGNRHALMIFTNTGVRPCTLQGYPGVSFLTAEGTSIEPEPQRFDGATASVTLEPGGAAHAYLHESVAENFPEEMCTPTRAATLRVYPPDETTALAVPYPKMKCAQRSTTFIGPVYPGTTVAPGEEQGA